MKSKSNGRKIVKKGSKEKLFTLATKWMWRFREKELNRSPRILISNTLGAAGKWKYV